MPTLKHAWPYFLLCLFILNVPGIYHGNQAAVAATEKKVFQNHFDSESSLNAVASSEELGLVQVGEYIPIDLEINAHNELSQSRTIYSPAAAFIKVHFQTFCLPPGVNVTISDATGIEQYSYPNESDFLMDCEGKGFWAMSITGDTAVITLHTTPEPDNLTTTQPEPYHLHIDKYARGYSPAQVALLNETNRPESTCTDLERYDAICYASSHPIEYEKSNAVARLLVTKNSGTYVCTAWRASSLNRIITNEHCVNSQADVERVELWFNYQAISCNGDVDPNITKVMGKTLLVADAIHDVAVFTINDFASVQQFGFLNFDIRPPILGEVIYIPQHGSGNPREFGIESSINSGNVCRIDDAIRNGYGYNTDTGYFCDTIGGSSGSPVLARSSHDVVALHHFGAGGAICTDTLMNAGVRVDKLWPIIQPYFSIMSGDTYEPDNVAGNATPIINEKMQIHSIFPAGDKDWVTFSLARETAVSLQTSGSIGDTRMWLYDSNFQEIEFNDNGDGTTFSTINRVCGGDALPAGNYFVKIDALENDDEISEYTLHYAIDDNCNSTNSELITGDFIVDDDNNNQSSGNNNNKINSSESVELYFNLAKNSSETATKIYACISEDSSFVTGPLHNSCSVFGNIREGNYAINHDDFDFEIAPDAPGNHVINFTLNVTYGNANTTEMVTYSVPVQAKYQVYLPMVVGP